MPEAREHIFVTKNHFEKCDKYGLYGVSFSTINSLSLVNKGDLCYILQKPNREMGQEGYLYGPYAVISDPFYDPTLIWDGSKGIEKYCCKVRVKRSDPTYRIDIYQLTDIIERTNLRLQTAELKQFYDVVTLVPKDQGILTRALPETAEWNGQETEEPPVSPIPLDSKNIIETRKGKITEGIIEYLLIRNPPSFMNLFLLNQFRLSIMQDIVDVLGVSEDRIIVAELKDTPKKLISNSVGTKLNAYAEGCRKLTELLARVFKIDIRPDAKVEQYLISAKVINDDLVFVDQDERELR